MSSVRMLCRRSASLKPDARMVDECTTWHPTGFDPCTLAVVKQSLSLAAASYVYDTSSKGGTLYDAGHDVVLQSPQTLVQIDGTTVAVLAVGQLTTDAGSRLEVIGPLPLLLV